MPEINIEVDFGQVTKSLDDLADAYGTRARKSVVRSAIRKTLRSSVAKMRARALSYSRSMAKSITVRSQDRKTRRRKGRRRIGLAIGMYPRVGPGRYHSFTGYSEVQHVGSIEYGRRRKGVREAAHQRQLRRITTRKRVLVPTSDRVKVTRGAHIMQRIWASDSRRWIRQFAKTCARQWRNRLTVYAVRTH